MLQKLIAEIQAGGTLNTTALASRLDTTPQMVKAMLDHLAQMGVLRESLSCEIDHCQGCPVMNSCHSSPKDSQMRMWSLRQDELLEKRSANS